MLKAPDSTNMSIQLRLNTCTERLNGAALSCKTQCSNPGAGQFRNDLDSSMVSTFHAMVENETVAYQSRDRILERENGTESHTQD